MFNPSAFKSIRNQMLKQLSKIVKQAKEDRKESTRVFGFEDGYIKRMYEYTDKICANIDGLVLLYDCPQEMFGAYYRIRKFIYQTPDKREANTAFGQLLIIAHSAIPSKIYDQ